MIEVRTPANQFFDKDGTPLDAGYIYIGATGANPETTPQSVYWDKDGLIPAAQPIRTINGFPARDGAVSKFYTTTKNYSITVKDKRGILVMGVLNSDSGVFDELSSISGAASVGYDNASSGLAAVDVQEAIDEVQANIDSVVEAQNSQSGLVNLFMNSAFLINQRGYASGAATTGANQYTIDRIRVVVSGQSLTFTAGTFGNRITAPAGGAEQVVEGIYIVGGDYACTWAGTGAIQVNGVAKAKNEVFTLPAGSNATIRMFGEFEQFVLTRPDMLGRYEYDYHRDLYNCSRYLPALIATGASSNWGVGVCTNAATALGSFAITFPVTARVAPTGVTVSAALSNLAVAGNGVSSSVNSVTFSSASTSRATLNVAWSGGSIAVGDACFLNTGPANIRLLFNGCEL